MPVAYITRSWRVVWFDFGPTLDDQFARDLPAVLYVREFISDPPGTPATPGESVPAWLVTPSVLALLCWQVDSRNANAPPGCPDATKRVNRWLSVLDALGDVWQRLRPAAHEVYERYQETGGPPPLPTPPPLLTLPTMCNFDAALA